MERAEPNSALEHYSTFFVIAAPVGLGSQLPFAA